MAYKLPLTPECSFDVCRRAASYVVFDDKKSTVGEFCKTHADKRVRELNRTEEAVEAAHRAAPIPMARKPA
jgi:hypothetical protein